MFLKPSTPIIRKLKHVILPAIFICLLLYTRIVGITWGLPYPMHPDERNMTAAVLKLDCHGLNTECMNPHFYAYGQLPLYIAYISSHLAASVTHSEITFELVTIILRLISVAASLGTAWVLWKIHRLLFKPYYITDILQALLIIFVPVFIQFAHFGTTESLLMLFYSLLLYISLLLIAQKINLKKCAVYSGIILGLAIGVKVSSVLFAAIPFFAMIWHMWKTRHSVSLLKNIISLVRFGVISGSLSAAFYVISSPYNLIGFQEFLGSMRYESDVGFGIYRAFYTRQFEYTIPVLYQIVKSFPYALGSPLLILFFFSYLFLPWNKFYVFLRLQFLLFFFPNAFFYAKWTRFLAPLYPLMILMSMSFINQLASPLHLHNASWKKYHIFWLSIISTVMISIIPGVAYLSIYTSPDVRFTASNWIYKNVKEYGPIISETANVVDIPFPTSKEGLYPNVDAISFNFYEMHNVPELKKELNDYLHDSEYIFVPSRRVFANHTCMWPADIGYTLNANKYYLLLNGYDPERCARLQKDYPDVNAYYKKIFDPSKYVMVKEFTSYPRIEILGKTLLEFEDEMSEETWTVFDHPVVRIYRKI